MTEKEARQLTERVKKGFADVESALREVLATQAWLPLGYDSFIAWFDAELSGIELAKGVRNFIVYAMLEEGKASQAEIGVRFGYAPQNKLRGQAISPPISKLNIQRKAGVPPSEASDANYLRVRYQRGRGTDRYLPRTASADISADTHDAIGEVARKQNCNRADVLRRYIADGLRKDEHLWKPTDKPTPRSRKKANA